jgi:hypothetical protein
MRPARCRGIGLLVLILAVSLLPACGAEQGELIVDTGNGPSHDATDSSELVVTGQQAGDAIADAMLAASAALYMALLSRADSDGVTSEDGALSLTWSDDADFATGVGSYVIVLDRFTVAEHTDFGPQSAAGYTLGGTIMLKSEDGVQSSLLMDLVADHADRDHYPVETIEVELTGYMAESDEPQGYVRVNGTEMSFSEIAGAFNVAASATRPDPTE